MSVTISPDQLQETINTILREFVDVTNDVVDEAAKAAADHAAESLRQSSPSLSGDYARGWAVKIDNKAKKANRARVIVYNRTDYQLTHLLENGHAKVVWGHRTGDRVGPKVHIKPVETKANAEFLARIRSGIGK